MVKPVGSTCNMRCSYCYYLPVNVSGHIRMSETDLEKMIRNCIDSSAGPVVSFVWHGGEPTLATRAFYQKAVELQKKYLPEGWQCWNNLQTNGLALDDEWCSFLAENHFDVGISLDGTRDVHNANRHDAAGNDTYDRIAESVERLKKHGIRPDLLCTVNSESVMQPLKVYENLKSLNTGWMQFIPVVNRDPDGTVREESVAPEDYGNFLCTIFNQWIYHDLGKVNVQLFIEIVNVMAGGEASLCWLQPTCGKVPVIEADGKVYSCDHFVRASHCIGDINKPISGLLSGERQLKFGNYKKDGLTKKCRKCRYLKLCNGGCPKDRFLVNEDGEKGQYYLCEGLLKLLRLSEGPVRRLIELNQLHQDRQTIMKTLLQQESRIRNSIGRNDPCPCGSGLKFKLCCGKYPVR